ncbi:hypothetical protein JTE90_022757 [Oedothorax gibbosus]|uniref:SEC14-like protein 2 n=1 Tax=Oedothorax gibbosus TaxID=931172 RepID=A0AAV6U9B5_9ARAC|nr:hypothetical protein JTE90_022757 [Oedothorax gibbosus]
MTHDQELAIKELKSRFAVDEIPTEMCEDTHTFHRFLKARDYNLNNAEHMLRNHLAWRKEFKLDAIKDYVSKEVLVKYFPGSYIGNDKEGCPVTFIHLGNLDPKGIRRAAKFIPDIVMHVIKVIEKDAEIMKDQAKKLGKPLTGGFYIVDLKNFPFSVATDKKTLEHAIYLSKMYQDNYPESLKEACIINVSPYFTLFFNVVKHFLAPSIVKKTKFYSTDEYKEDLRKLIDPDVLPAFLGGNRTDPDGNPLCLSFLTHCGPVEEKYFIQKNSRCLAKEPGVQRLLVSRVSLAEIELEVVELGSVIEWEFETRSRDIGFGLFFKELDEDSGSEKIVELVPLMRLDTEDFSETGVHKCEQTGTYIIVFDNSYSWFRSKEIFYRAVVKTPAEHEESLKYID